MNCAVFRPNVTDFINNVEVINENETSRFLAVKRSATAQTKKRTPRSRAKVKAAPRGGE